MSADASRLRAALTAWAGDVMAAVIVDAPNLVREDAPLGESTPTSRPPGELRASIGPGELRTDVERAVGTIVATAPQSKYTDQGTTPHPIFAVNAPMLRFWWANGPAGARIYYFRSVNHPGNAAQNWWEPAVRRAFETALTGAARSTAFG